VFRTYEPDRDRLVAVKAFRIDITPEQAQALAHELSLAAEAGLFHPSIVEPIAAGVEDTLAYGAEEYVAAESLDIALRHYAPASIETVLPFITQLAGAIDFARAAGVGHGALHPRDIFVTPEEARATGFGVVEALERIGLRAPVRRPYSPPERIAGTAWSTPADVFSLAAITFELLTGRRPAGLGKEIGPLTAGTPNSWMDALHGVLARAMDASPSIRFQTALEFAAALEASGRGAIAAPTASGTVVVPPAAEPAVNPLAAAAAASAVPTPQPSPSSSSKVGAEKQPRQERERPRRKEKTEEAPDLPLDQEGAAQSQVDEFILEAASAATAQNVLDDFRPAPPVDTRGLEDEEMVVDEPPSSLSQPQDLLHETGAERDRPDIATSPPPIYRPVFGENPAVVHDTVSEGRSRWPLAIVLIVGLIGGLGAGYVLWGRSSVPVAPAETTSKAAAPSPKGREFSEQTVTPPSAKPSTEAPRTAATQTPAATPAASGASGSSPAGVATSGAAAPKPIARTSDGTIVVRSTPSGAGVLVNGRWRGRTPLTLEQLPLTRYDVRVVREGYAPATQTVALSADQSARSLTFRLQESPRGGVAAQRPVAPPATAPTKPQTPAASETFTGSIFVDSRPRGARVSIDGRPVGVTPLRVPDVRIGTRIVRLELPDHRIWSSTARVSAGQEARVTGSLERIQ
jgi:serine/threonine protein kinase